MPRSGIRICLLLVIAVATGLSGCSTTQYATLREKPRNPLVDRLKLLDPGGPQPSQRTTEWLVSTGAGQSGHQGTRLHHARRLLSESPTNQSLHAAAELSYLAARQTEDSDADLAEELYLDAAHFSWRYLTGALDGQIRDPNDDRHRPTTEIYNSSVEGFLRLLNRQRSDEYRESLSLPLTARDIHFEVPHPSPWIDPEQVGEIEFVSDYEVRNLHHRHVSRGIGAPIMIRRQRPSNPSPLEDYYAEGVRFPATAVLSFPTPEQQRNGVPIRLQVYDPRESDGVLAGDTLLPMETDLSTPLARFLTNPDLELLDTFAFLRPDKAQSLRGLYMVQPWDPDRIPVLMVHGLWSSPMTWMEMFNDLQSDPVLRDNYQFWFYMYPTGEPLAFALADLREELEELQQRCDPQDENKKLDQMVLVGHSMGGLLSYLMTVDSEEAFWDSVSDVPVEQLQADTGTAHEIQRVFFFESDPSIDRIVTIASPFQGSRYANRFTRWLGRTLVSLPASTMKVTSLITGLNRREGWEKVFAPDTSLDSLAKHSAVLRLVGQTTTPDEVAHHNIVGIARGRSRKWWTDGVVTWRSAHRDDADSELTVRASHSQVHRHEESIEEVSRVLKDHLRRLQRGRKVIPVSHQAEKVGQ